MMPKFAPYAESTKQRIVGYLNQHPGSTGREIAVALGLDKSRVNSFLYSEGARRFNLKVENWKWFTSDPHSRFTGNVNCLRCGSQFRPEQLGLERGYMMDLRSCPNCKDLPDRGDRTRQYSICGALIQMNTTDASLKIRGLTEIQINLAFAEEDYTLLDDLLKAELAIRRQELLTSKQAEAKQKSPFSNPLLVITIGLMAFIFIGNLMNNSSTERTPSREVPASRK